uniref:Uncharacterized protein n=1 Tax=Saccharum hybrid cultivar R570 TaxID=131158 RepID=A0A059PZQ9_9POAL|nr:hypothetical protein SHCRBa_159_H10_R_10 [Saccharum hybrid cultivar R570]
MSNIIKEDIIQKGKRLTIKTLCPCLKQRPGSLHCGYYICCMMSNTSAYRRHPNLWKEELDTKRDVYKDDELLGLVGDLCSFIIDQVPGGKSYGGGEAKCNKYVSNISATSVLMARSSPTILVSSILFDPIDLVN